MRRSPPRCSSWLAGLSWCGVVGGVAARSRRRSWDSSLPPRQPRLESSEHNQTQKRSEELFNDWGLHNQPKIDLSKELLTEVTHDSSMITKRELRAKAYELSAGVGRPAEADRLVDDLARSGELLQLEDGTWTTRQLREQEQTTIEIAERRASEHAGGADWATIGNSKAQPPWSELTGTGRPSLGSAR
jgi:hypothetical protein